MEEKQLRLFIACAQLGSFQQAADQQFMSQRAVSKRISNLEDELGTKLFNREKNKIILTTAGHHFLARAMEILNTMQLANYETKQFAPKQQHISVGYFSPFDGALLRSALLSLPPTVNTIIEEKGSEHLISDVLLGRLDCALILQNQDSSQIDQNNLVSLPILESPLVIGASPQYQYLDQIHHLTTTLRQLPVIYYSVEESEYLQNIFKVQLGQLASVINMHRVTSYEHMQLLVSLGKALSFYPERLLDQISNPHDAIQYIPLNTHQLSATFMLIYRRDCQNPVVHQLGCQLKSTS